MKSAAHMSGVESSWPSIRFGKYKGLSLPQIVFRDPDYFFWAFQNTELGRDPLAIEVYRKARRIIPVWKGRTDWLVEYSYLGPYGSFGFELVEPQRPVHEGGSLAIRKCYIDLAAAREYKNYDKTGGKLLLDCLKATVFDNPSYRFTKKVAEEFFSDDNNFAHSRSQL
jgi:hypothetical protein